MAGIAATALIGAACSLGEQTDTDSPIVAITAPLKDSTVGGAISFAAQVLDEFGVAKVEFIVDGQVIDEDPISPFATTWNTRAGADGPHALQVRATDLSGNVGSASIGVTVDNTKQ